MDELKKYEDKMNKTLDVLKEDFGTIRAGRANPHVLDTYSAGRKCFSTGGTDDRNPALGQEYAEGGGEGHLDL